MSSCLQPKTLQADLRSVCGLLKSTPTLMRKWTGSLLSGSQTQRRAMGRHCWLTLTRISGQGYTSGGFSRAQPPPLVQSPAHPKTDCCQPLKLCLLRRGQHLPSLPITVFTSGTQSLEALL